MNSPYEIFDLSESLKTKSYPYYFCLLTTPRHKQDALALLWGIASELRFVPLSVTNPLAGFMRLAAWRERLPTWGMENLIDWLNTYEVYFDETISIKTHWPQYIEGESLLVSHSLHFLLPGAWPLLIDAARVLGEILGLIYLLQSDHKFGFASDQPFKEELATAVKSRLITLKKLNDIPKECHSLFSLLGYAQVWYNKYTKTYTPVTLTEPTIQWSILKHRLKLWWDTKSLKI